MNESKTHNHVAFLQMFCIFFLLFAFVMTVSDAILLSGLRRTAGVPLSESSLRLIAVVTFSTVLILSLVCAAVDTLRRKIMVERPVRRITEGMQRVMNGELSVRIEQVPGGDSVFNTVIDCFNRLIRELSGTETLRTDFIADVSHELKTPLAVIQNYGTMLQQPGLSEEERIDYAHTVTGAVGRLTNLVTNILKLNKLENQQIFPEKECFDLSEQLCGCLLGFEGAWEEKNLDIETEIEDGITVENDPELLSIIWNNLFSNAVKFTGDGGTVGLKVYSDGDFAIVEVSDTGCGISPEVGVHIFEKFYQGDSSRAAQGNGLGLALVRRVMDIVGGEIGVSSEPGKGSVFTVKLRCLGTCKTEPAGGERE